jgi:hypothetical protein
VACCLPDGSCIDADPLCCQLSGGTPLPPGSSCQPEVACCLPDGTCDMRDPLCCEISGGTPTPGVTCAGTLEACCLPSGICADRDPACCLAAGGVPQGPGTNCATTPCNLDCAPNPPQTGCNPHQCPIAGQICIPTAIECGPPPLGCRVVDCDCRDPNVCHVNLPPVGANLPFCSGICPPFKKCIRFQKDLNGNGNPEWFCKCVKVIKPLPDLVHADKARYISFESAADPGEEEYVHITMVNVDGFPAFNGQVRWAGPMALYPENPGPLPTFPGTRTGCTPEHSDWASMGVSHITGAEIVPRSTYDIRTVSSECEDLAEPECYSDPLTVMTQKWGDIVAAFGGAGQPNFLDISAAVDKFKALPGAPIKARCQQQANVPNPAVPINFLDISACVDSFMGKPYPFSGPCTCPPATVCPVLDACGRCSP